MSKGGARSTDAVRLWLVGRNRDLLANFNAAIDSKGIYNPPNFATNLSIPLPKISS